MTQPITSRVKVSDVINAVAHFYDIPPHELISASRKWRLCRPRQLAAYLAREMTGCSYPLIGRVMGDRDHTTILFSWRKISSLRETNERLDERLDDLFELILLERQEREEGAAKLRQEIDLQSWEAVGSA